MGLFDKAMDMYLKKHGDQIVEAIGKVNDGGTYEDIDTIVNDYFQILKKFRKKNPPNFVELDKTRYYMLLLDGEECDLDALIPHNDTHNTERMMEIDVLLSDKAFLPEIQNRLNAKIHNDW